MKLARIFMVLMALAILLVATVADEKEDKPEAKATENTKEKESKTGSVVNATATVEKSSDGVDDKAAETATVEEPDSTASTEPDATIEVNPDYVSDDEESDEESDDEYDSEDEEEEDSKSVLDMALAQSRKVPRKAIDFVQKNRVKITVALALIAFRREIGRVILNKIAPPTGVDPKTGKVIRQWMKVEPTAILKIVVFIDIMRQLQGAGKKRDPVIIAFLLLGARNPILSSLISKAILQENNSFVPQPEQHYTFEKLNDR